MNPGAELLMGKGFGKLPLVKVNFMLFIPQFVQCPNTSFLVSSGMNYLRFIWKRRSLAAKILSKLARLKFILRSDVCYCIKSRLKFT